MTPARFLIVMAAAALTSSVAQLKAEPQWGAPAQAPRYSQTASAALNEGYTRGLRAGEEDGRRGQPFTFNDESDYRRADNGYRSQYGSRDRYRDQFRDGFEQGYREGYRRYAYDRRNGPPWSNGRGPGRLPNNRDTGPYGGGYNQYANVAFENGFNDGYDEGRSDGRARRANDPIAERRYRSADHGFNDRYGSRDAYKNTYRQGFLQGYQRGYREDYYR